jgi:hypothetical protein
MKAFKELADLGQGNIKLGHHEESREFTEQTKVQVGSMRVLLNILIQTARTTKLKQIYDYFYDRDTLVDLVALIKMVNYSRIH